MESILAESSPPNKKEDTLKFIGRSKELKALSDLYKKQGLKSASVYVLNPLVGPRSRTGTDEAHELHQSVRSEATGGAFSMKYSFEEKIEAVKLHLKDGSYRYPERCNTEAKRRSYGNQVRLWEAQYLLKGEEGIRQRKKDLPRSSK